MGWRATTRTGTVYTFQHGRVRIETQGIGSSYFTAWDMKVSTRNADDREPLGLPWMVGYEDDWVDSWKPVVGQHLYVVGKDEWRASTPVVSVEELPDD